MRKQQCDVAEMSVLTWRRGRQQPLSLPPLAHIHLRFRNLFFVSAYPNNSSSLRLSWLPVMVVAPSTAQCSMVTFTTKGDNILHSFKNKNFDRSHLSPTCGSSCPGSLADSLWFRRLPGLARAPAHGPAVSLQRLRRLEFGRHLPAACAAAPRAGQYAPLQKAPVLVRISGTCE
jgi:hypothetical protein